MVGGGVIEERNGQSYVKAALADYLREMTFYFRKVGLLSPLSTVPGRYQNSLEELGVKGYPWRPKPFHMLHIIVNLIQNVDRRTGVWLQLPQTLLFPIMPLLRARAGMFITYVAGDWLDIAHELRAKGKVWRAPLDKAAVELPLGWADYVLVRGPKIFQQAQLYNPKVVQSLPIISSRQGYTLREDSCKGESITVLYVGKLLFAKGVGILLKAFGQIVKKDNLSKRLRLCVVGDGEEHEAIVQLANDIGLHDSIDFRGYVDDPVQLGRAYREADILVIPSIESEGMPRVLEEGLQHSLPVVATCVGGVPLAYTDCEDIMMVPPGSSEELARAIGTVIRDENVRRRLITRAQEQVSSLRFGHTAARQHAEIVLGRPITRHGRAGANG